MAVVIRPLYWCKGDASRRITAIDVVSRVVTGPVNREVCMNQRMENSKSKDAVPMCEELEERRLLSASVSNGALTVVGTRHSDSITVTRGGRRGAFVYVSVDGAAARFSSRSVRSLSISGGRGADDISIAANFAPAGGATVSGGDGNDTIHGGGGHEHLFGEAGDDSILGGDGGDTLSGGLDDDSLVGGAGDDHIDGDGGIDHEEGGQGTDDLVGGRQDDVNDDNGQDAITHDANEDNGGQGVDDPVGDNHGVKHDSVLQKSASKSVFAM
jgi:hypothetical protein